MDGLQWNTLLKWMIWGAHPYFWKHPNRWNKSLTFIFFIVRLSNIHSSNLWWQRHQHEVPGKSHSFTGSNRPATTQECSWRGGSFGRAWRYLAGSISWNNHVWDARTHKFLTRNVAGISPSNQIMSSSFPDCGYCDIAFTAQVSKNLGRIPRGCTKQPLIS